MSDWYKNSSVTTASKNLDNHLPEENTEEEQTTKTYVPETVAINPVSSLESIHNAATMDDSWTILAVIG